MQRSQTPLVTDNTSNEMVISYPVFRPEILHAFGTQCSFSSVNYDSVHFSSCHGPTTILVVTT